jgi:iron complex outermembrane recepter protein
VSGYFDSSRHALDNLTDTVYPYGGTAANLETFAQLSQELRATSTFSGPLKLIGGLYYEHSHLRTGNAAMVGPFGPDPVTGKYETWDRYSYETGDAYSGFAQARWTILPNVELAGGARYTHEYKTGTLYNSFAHPAFAALLAPAGRVIGGSLSENNVSPEATLTWHPTDETMLYGAFKTGYKSGGFGAPSIVTANIQTGADIEYKPEKVKGGEIGAKMQLLDDQLRLTATVYHYRYTDLQISDFIAATISQLTLNAGSSKTDGFEAEAQWRVNHDLTVNGGFGYSHARYISFNNIACYGGQTADTGCNEATGLQDLSGKPLFRAPDYTANLGFDYQHPLAGGFMMGLSGNVRYSDGYFTQEADSAFATQNAYVIVDATLRLFTESDRWSLDLIGRNLNNKRYAIASLDASSAPAGTVDSVISRPRQIELDISARF